MEDDLRYHGCFIVGEDTAQDRPLPPSDQQVVARKIEPMEIHNEAQKCTQVTTVEIVSQTIMSDDEDNGSDDHSIGGARYSRGGETGTLSDIDDGIISPHYFAKVETARGSDNASPLEITPTKEVGHTFVVSRAASAARTAPEPNKETSPIDISSIQKESNNASSPSYQLWPQVSREHLATLVRPPSPSRVRSSVDHLLRDNNSDEYEDCKEAFEKSPVTIVREDDQRSSSSSSSTSDEDENYNESRRASYRNWRERRKSVHRFIFGDDQNNGSLFTGSPPKSESVERKTLRVLMALFLLLSVNVLGAWVFNAAELKKELKTRREQRVDLFTRLPRFAIINNVTSEKGTQSTMQLHHDAINSAEGFNVKKLQCGACTKNKIDFESMLEVTQERVNDLVYFNSQVLKILKYNKEHMKEQRLYSTLQEEETENYEGDTFNETSNKGPPSQEPRFTLDEIDTAVYEALAISWDLDLTKICRKRRYIHKCDWRFASSFFFTMTIMTSIGYGSFYPRTNNGKIAFIIFGALGLFVVTRMIQALGDLMKAYFAQRRQRRREQRIQKHLALASKAAKGKMTDRTNGIFLPVGEHHLIPISSTVRSPNSYTGDGDEAARRGSNTSEQFDENNQNNNHHQSCFDRNILKFAFTVVCAYLLLGGFIFQKTEAWSFFNAVYFAFGTLSTIGLGDFVPSTSISHIFPAWLYIFFGLAIVSFLSTALAKVEHDFLSHSHSLHLRRHYTPGAATADHVKATFNNTSDKYTAGFSSFRAVMDRNDEEKEELSVAHHTAIDDNDSTNTTFLTHQQQHADTPSLIGDTATVVVELRTLAQDGSSKDVFNDR